MNNNMLNSQNNSELINKISDSEINSRFAFYLKLLAAFAFILGLILGILGTTSEHIYTFDAPLFYLNYDDDPNSALTFLIPFADGIFICGLFIGFSSMISHYKKNTQSIWSPFILYFSSMITFVIALVIAFIAIDDFGVYGGLDSTDKPQFFLWFFLPGGVLYSGVLFSMGMLISSNRHDTISRINLKSRTLFLMGLLGLVLGIVLASLAVHNMDGASNTDKSSFFLYFLLTHGVLFGGILFGFSFIISLQKYKLDNATCSSCGCIVFPDWKICPYCTKSLM